MPESESLSELLIEYVGLVKKLNAKIVGGKESTERRAELGDKILGMVSTALQEGVDKAERVEIKDWDDWGERNHETLEIVRGDKIIAFKIQSLTMAELREARLKTQRAAGPEPKPPMNNGRVDLEDRDYKKRLSIYEESLIKADHLMQLYLIEYGWANANGIEIPGDTDEEKMKALETKVAGDLPELTTAIYAASNLGEPQIKPFTTGSFRRN